jgi:hypothetical protein
MNARDPLHPQGPLVDRRPRPGALQADRAAVIDAADLAEERARQDSPFSSYEKTRLHLAGQIAAGLCANPQTYRMQSWQGEVARNAISMADKILMVHLSGSC